MEVETSNPLSAYDILGVAPIATQDDIRTAYRIAARRYHPDINSDPDAKDLFILITEAYELLSDITRRRKYDAVRKILQQEEKNKAKMNNNIGNQFNIGGSASGNNINIRPQYTSFYRTSGGSPVSYSSASIPSGSATIHIP